jgi:hypothetical protein
MFLNEVLERGQRVRLLSGEKGIIIGKNENFEFPLWEIKLENGKILTEARYTHYSNFAYTVTKEALSVSMYRVG